MEKYNIKEFIDKFRIDTSMNDMLHVCKRFNNKKRDYLFVNKYQGKHVPVSPVNVYKAMSELYNKAYESLKDEKRMLFVGFAETATAIGETLFYYATQSDKPLDVVEYVHTTRESLNLQELINFQEEHCHAPEQRLFIRDKDIDFDSVVFIEDEISTGNTILNFIRKFDTVRKIKHFYVVSFANWQSKEDLDKFIGIPIKFISLASGTIKDKSVTLSVDCNDYIVYNDNEVQLNFLSCMGYHDARGGITPEELCQNYQICDILSDRIEKNITHNDTVEVIGTEEFMGFPLRVAKVLEDRGYTVNYHATTRSPIQTASDCIITDGSNVESAYEVSRINYLYNMKDRDYTKIVVISDGRFSSEFISSIKAFNKPVIFVNVNQ